MGPVEESWFAPAPDHQPEENDFLLNSKLQEEANYHHAAAWTGVQKSSPNRT